MRVLVVLLVGLGIAAVEGAIREEVKAKAGGEVQLHCMINKEECGDFHSIKWYKENRRVYVYSPIANFAKAEGELADRAQQILEGSNATLQISSLETSDEGEYKCEITFLDITKDCPVVQLIKLTTLAEPKYLNITVSGDSKDVSGSIIGPFSEGHEIRLTCESGGGKPIPKVTWYNGSDIISGKASSFESEDGTGTGRNEVRLKLGRGDLGSQFSCQAENEAINEPLSTTVQIDVNLRPLKTTILGADAPVEEGGVVSLMCRSAGARPAAMITWYNGSTPFTEQPTGEIALQKPPVEVTVKQGDNTYETQSRISFVASRYENGEFITCEATNDVLEAYQEPPQRAATTLQVLFSPVVDISPLNQTANETDQVRIDCTFEGNPTILKSVRWYRNGQLVPVKNVSRYEGGTVDDPSLVIKSVERGDTGTYTCVLENDVGPGEPGNVSVLQVQYTPSVMLRMDPEDPISELDRSNVTLLCDVISGYPSQLTGVKWFMDGELLKSLPQCDEDGINRDLCDIDPSKLLLEHVSRHFHGNFSCEGVNAAGWSKRSPERELVIYYPPGPAFIAKDIEEVIKGSRITLTCGVTSLGRPEATVFEWRRGGHVITDVNSFNWTIDPVTLETEANISCVAVNEVGAGEEDFINIEVFAPPQFINRLPPYTGAMAEAGNFSISCQVECSPLCDVFWLKDGIPIDEDDRRFTIDSDFHESDFAKNDFESVSSTLYWNFDAWPGGKLERIMDDANYTCQSTGNLVGKDGVSSTTYFRVEYPPENIEISNNVVTVEEGTSSDKVLCTAEAYPEANFVWKFLDEMVATDNLLFFKYGISRDQAGEYECVAQNRHGSSTIKTVIDVLYKPECTIRQTDEDGQILLLCEADANPTDVTFMWKRVNESIPDSEVVSELVSAIRLDAVPESFGTYYCYVNNSLGRGSPCEIDVQGIGLLRSGSANIIIIVAVIAAVIVALLIVVVIIILICRKKKPNEKYTNTEDREERENAHVPAEKDQAPPPVHKWPIRPGVHVHVNGLHTLAAPTVKADISGFSYGTRNSGSGGGSSDESNHNTSADSSEKDEKDEAGKVHVEQQQSSSTTATSSLRSAKKKKIKQDTPGQKVSPDQAGPEQNGQKPTYENLPFHGFQPQNKQAPLTEATSYNFHQSLPRHMPRGGAPPVNSSRHYYDSRQASSSSSSTNSTTASTSTRSHPLKTISYYSTVGRDMVPHGRDIIPHGHNPLTIKPPKQFDSYYYHPSTLPPPSEPAPPPPTGRGVVYADLALQGPSGHRDRTATDYAILKFNAGGHPGTGHPGTSHPGCLPTPGGDDVATVLGHEIDV